MKSIKGTLSNNGELSMLLKYFLVGVSGAEAALLFFMT